MDGGDSPKTPDYTGAAQATAQGNLEAARATAAANRVNQVTPYGNLTYTQAPTTDWGGYNSAMSAYQSQMDAYNQALKNAAAAGARTDTGSLFGMNHGDTDTIANRQGLVTSKLTAPTAPKLADYQNLDGGWTATVDLAPEQKAQLDAKNKLLSGLYGQASKLLGSQVDTSALPQMPQNAGMTTQNAIMSRLSPQIDKERNALSTQLLNQGITQGSEAWGNAMTSQDQRENDLLNQAALSGVQTDMSARQQALAEALQLRDQPINELAALNSGAQIGYPQFNSVAQQSNVNGPDYTSATNALGQWQQGMYSADQAAANSTNSSVAGLAGMAAMAYFM